MAQSRVARGGRPRAPRPLSNRSKRTCSKRSDCSPSCGSAIYAGPEADTFALGRYNPRQRRRRARAGDALQPLLRARSRRRAARRRVADARSQRLALQHARHRRGLSEPRLSTSSRCASRVTAPCRPGCATCGGKTGTRRSSPPRGTRRRAAEAASPSTSAATRPAPRWPRSMRCARSTTRSCRSRKGSISSPPAIGISPFAVLTNVISGLAFIPGFEKSRWIDVFPEYDPYKYNSFPVNAANQIHTLTGVLRDALDDAGRRGRLAAMPRVVVFQSIVDSTITAARGRPRLARALAARRSRARRVRREPDRRHARVDRCRTARGSRDDSQLDESAVSPDAGRRAAARILARLPPIRAKPAPPRSARTELGLEWPNTVFSLGHVSLPFPADDPVYGIALPPGRAPAVQSRRGCRARRERCARALARLLLEAPQQSVLRRHPHEDRRDAHAGRASGRSAP